jgi:hypothetical protein
MNVVILNANNLSNFINRNIINNESIEWDRILYSDKLWNKRCLNINYRLDKFKIINNIRFMGESVISGNTIIKYMQYGYI